MAQFLNAKVRVVTYGTITCEICGDRTRGQIDAYCRDGWREESTYGLGARKGAGAHRHKICDACRNDVKGVFGPTRLMPCIDKMTEAERTLLALARERNGQQGDLFA